MTGIAQDPAPAVEADAVARPVAVNDVVPVAADLDVDALDWRTSTYSSGQHPDSLQVVAVPGGGLAIRNGAHPDAGVVTCSRWAWTAFARALMVGEHLVRL